LSCVRIFVCGAELVVQSQRRRAMVHACWKSSVFSRRLKVCLHIIVKKRAKTHRKPEPTGVIYLQELLTRSCLRLGTTALYTRLHRTVLIIFTLIQLSLLRCCLLEKVAHTSRQNDDSAEALENGAEPGASFTTDMGARLPPPFAKYGQYFCVKSQNRA